jgi:predicted RNase H-like HicB family nuclease
LTMSSTMKSHLIEVGIEYHPDGCWAISSKNLPGLVMAGKDIEALIGDLPNAIKLLYKLNYQLDVQVAIAGEDGASLHEERKSAFIPLPSKFVALSAAA